MTNDQGAEPESGWRVGRKVPRNLYLDGKDIGRVDTAELAAEIVRTMNEARARGADHTEAAP